MSTECPGPPEAGAPTGTPAEAEVSVTPAVFGPGASTVGSGPGRLVWLDGLRGLAVVGVVAIHVLAGTLLSPSRQTPGGLVWLVTLDAVARCSVPLFLMASGLLLTLSGQRRPLTCRQFLRRRAARVLPAYLAWTAVYTALQTPPPAEFAGRWLRHSLLGDASYHTWFVPVILYLYLAHPLLARGLGRACRSRRAATRLLVGLVLWRFGVARWGVPWPWLGLLPAGLADLLRTGPLAALHWSPWFLGGMAAAAWLTDPTPPGRAGRWWPVAGLVGLGLASAWRVSQLAGVADFDHAANAAILGWDAPSTLLAALGGVLCAGGLLQSPGAGRFAALLARLGPASYGLYLAHVLVLDALGRRPGFVVLCRLPETAAAAILLVTALSVVLVALLVRLPGLRLASGVELRR